MWFLLGLVVLVLVEITLLIQLGSAIGLWLTLGWIILTGLLGILFLKGVASLGPISSYRLDEFRERNSASAHRALVLIAGLMLILPGLLTDTFGLLLLFAPFRRAVIGYVSRRYNLVELKASVNVVDAEWRDVTAPSVGDKKDGGH